MKKIIAIALAVLLIIPLSILFTAAAETNIAAGKSYTFTGLYTDGTGNVPYPDTDNKELTDGVVAGFDNLGYSNALHPLWVGLNWKGAGTNNEGSSFTAETVAYTQIVVDLGAVENKLTRFLLNSEDFASVGIIFPKSVEVLVSNDNENFTSVGSTAGTRTIDGLIEAHPTIGIYEYEVKPSTPASGRYVKFLIKHGGSWCFVSEVEVYQDPSASEEETSTSDPVPEETYPLVSFDPTKWLSGAEQNGETATASLSGDAIVISGSVSSWPYAYYNIENPVKVDVDAFELVYDFTVSGGKANIVLFCEGSTVEDNNNYVSELTHHMAEEGSDQRPSGDDLKDGTYTGRIKLSDLNYTNVTILEEGKITISAVKVFSVGGGVITINQFELQSIATVTPESSDTSSAVSSATSSTASSQTSSAPVTPGDEGSTAMIIIAFLALAGIAVVAVKKRS